MKKPLLILLLSISATIVVAQDSLHTFKVAKPSSHKQKEASPIIEEKIFQICELMPEYPGGEEKLYKFIQSHLIYPDSAFHNKVEGRVMISFIVNTDGHLSDIKILKGVSPDINKEALRLIGLLDKFKPGMQQGKPVAVYFVIPIMFTLTDPASSRPHTPAKR